MKILNILLVLFFLSVGIAEAGTTIIKKKAAAGYSDVIFYWACDSTTADKSAGDTSAAQQVDAAIDTTSGNYQVGTGACDFPTSYSRYDFTLNQDDLIDVDAGRIGMWVRVDSGGNDSIFYVTYGAGNVLAVQTFGTNRLYLHYVAGSTGPNGVGTGDNAFSYGTWFFLEFSWNKGGAGNDFELFVNGTSVATNDDATGTWSKSTSGTLSAGSYHGNGMDVHIDQVIISNDPTRDLYALRETTSF